MTVNKSLSLGSTVDSNDIHLKVDEVKIPEYRYQYNFGSGSSYQPRDKTDKKVDLKDIRIR